MSCDVFFLCEGMEGRFIKRSVLLTEKRQWRHPVILKNTFTLLLTTDKNTEIFLSVSKKNNNI
jgi:hypothetical protein